MPGLNFERQTERRRNSRFGAIVITRGCRRLGFALKRSAPASLSRLELSGPENGSADPDGALSGWGGPTAGSATSVKFGFSPTRAGLLIGAI